MTQGDNINQSHSNIGIGFMKGATGPINVSTVQSYTAQFQSLVREIDKSKGSDAEKAEAKSLLKRFLEHPIVAGIAGGLAASLKL
jgi:hypothetical protein